MAEYTMPCLIGLLPAEITFESNEDGYYVLSVDVRGTGADAGSWYCIKDQLDADYLDELLEKAEHSRRESVLDLRESVADDARQASLEWLKSTGI